MCFERHDATVLPSIKFIVQMAELHNVGDSPLTSHCFFVGISSGQYFVFNCSKKQRIVYDCCPDKLMHRVEWHSLVQGWILAYADHNTRTTRIMMRKLQTKFTTCVKKINVIPLARSVSWCFLGNLISAVRNQINRDNQRAGSCSSSSSRAVSPKPHIAQCCCCLCCLTTHSSEKKPPLSVLHQAPSH